MNGVSRITLAAAASAVPQTIVNTASALTVLPQTDSKAANNSATVSVTSK